jgi:hypothetical protein
LIPFCPIATKTFFTIVQTFKLQHANTFELMLLGP